MTAQNFDFLRKLTKEYKHIRPGGYLFIGHAEKVPGIGENFESLGQAQFRRREGRDGC